VAADVLGAVACVDPTSASAIADTLIPRLHVEHDASVLDSVITALGHAGDSRARAGVVKHADHPDERVRLAVAWSLPSLGLDEGSLAAMRRLSSDPEAQVRDWATFGLAESDARDAATTEALAARSADPHDDTRAEAILGLARRHDPGARRLIERERSLPIYGSLIAARSKSSRRSPSTQGTGDRNRDRRLRPARAPPERLRHVLTCELMLGRGDRQQPEHLHDP
jgi:HEAT repeat protein